MVVSDKTGSYYKLLAEKATEGDKEAREDLINAFLLNAVSLQEYEKADKIAEESGMTKEEQSEYLRLALKSMSNRPGMELCVDEIKKHYNIK